MFTYEASAYPSGNQNIRTICNNPRCGKVFYVQFGAHSYRCPHCQRPQ